MLVFEILKSGDIKKVVAIFQRQSERKQTIVQCGLKKKVVSDGIGSTVYIMIVTGVCKPCCRTSI